MLWESEREGNPRDSTRVCTWVTEGWPACAWSPEPAPALALPSGQPGSALPPRRSSQQTPHCPANLGASLWHRAEHRARDEGQGLVAGT